MSRDKMSPEAIPKFLMQNWETVVAPRLAEFEPVLRSVHEEIKKLCQKSSVTNLRSELEKAVEPLRRLLEPLISQSNRSSRGIGTRALPATGLDELDERKLKTIENDFAQLRRRSEQELQSSSHADQPQSTQSPPTRDRSDNNESQRP